MHHGVDNQEKMTVRQLKFNPPQGKHPVSDTTTLIPGKCDWFLKEQNLLSLHLSLVLQHHGHLANLIHWFSQRISLDLLEKLEVIVYTNVLIGLN